MGRFETLPSSVDPIKTRIVMSSVGCPGLGGRSVLISAQTARRHTRPLTGGPLDQSHDFEAFRAWNAHENWRSEAWKHMFACVNRRLIRSLVYLLVLGQVLLSEPVAAALGSTGSSAASGMPCSDSMPQTDHSKPCPCCPDGTASVAACLSACTGSVAALSNFTVQLIRVAAPAPASVATLPTARIADPPLKPPPIV